MRRRSVDFEGPVSYEMCNCEEDKQNSETNLAIPILQEELRAPYLFIKNLGRMWDMPLCSGEMLGL